MVRSVYMNNSCGSPNQIMDDVKRHEEQVKEVCSVYFYKHTPSTAIHESILAHNIIDQCADAMMVGGPEVHGSLVSGVLEGVCGALSNLAFDATSNRREYTDSDEM
jgi:hypothetical protein